jgi:hypothetical protein
MDFDPNAYLDAPLEKPLERRPPIPAGDYPGVIENLTARMWQSKDKYDEVTGQLKSGLAFDIIVAVEVPEAVRVSCSLSAPTLKMKDSIMVDRTPEGAIDEGVGRNGRLRIYRDAVDMNKAGEVFRPRLMIGKPVKVRVGHRIPDGFVDPIEELKTVSRLG